LKDSIDILQGSQSNNTHTLFITSLGASGIFLSWPFVYTSSNITTTNKDEAVSSMLKINNIGKL